MLLSSGYHSIPKQKNYSNGFRVHRVQGSWFRILGLHYSSETRSSPCRSDCFFGIPEPQKYIEWRFGPF